MQSFSKGRLIAGFAIGVACGLMLPLLMITSAWFLPIPVILAFLWVWAGWPTVLVGMMSVTMAGYLYWNLGWGFALGMIVISLPGVISAALTQRRMPFYRAVGISVVIQLFSMFALTAAAWLFFRQNLVDVMTGALRGMIDEIPVYYQHYLALQMGQLGAFGSNTGINFASAILTDAQLQSLIDQLLYTISEGLKLSLPAYVLSSGAATGAMSYAAAAWVRVRRGDDPGHSVCEAGELAAEREPHHRAAGAGARLPGTDATSSCGRRGFVPGGGHHRAAVILGSGNRRTGAQAQDGRHDTRKANRNGRTGAPDRAAADAICGRILRPVWVGRAHFQTDS